MKSNLGSWGTRLPISIRLLIVSFLSLYFELALIRWLPSEIRILAYFTNLTLISCVLGLGIGAIFARKKPMPAATFPVLLGAMILFAKVYSGFQVRMPLTSGGYFLWGGLSWIPGTLMQYPVMFCFFLVNTIVFLPTGTAGAEAADAVDTGAGAAATRWASRSAASEYGCFSALGSCL